MIKYLFAQSSARSCLCYPSAQASSSSCSWPGWGSLTNAEQLWVPWTSTEMGLHRVRSGWVMHEFSHHRGQPPGARCLNEMMTSLGNIQSLIRMSCMWLSSKMHFLKLKWTLLWVNWLRARLCWCKNTENHGKGMSQPESEKAPWSMLPSPNPGHSQTTGCQGLDFTCDDCKVSLLVSVL